MTQPVRIRLDAPIDFPHLKNAPLTEAIIDIRTEVDARFNIKRFVELNLEGFPQAVQKTRYHCQVQAEPGKPPTQKVEDMGIHGVFFTSHDEKTVVQFRMDGFTFNRLAPYTSWEQIFPEAMRLWKKYIDVASPVEVSRIAARYINQIFLPLNLTDFSEYLTAPPQVPNFVSPLISAFVTRVRLHERELGLTATVAQAIQARTENAVPYVLDVDVWREERLSPNSEEIEKYLKLIRLLKNRIFFGSLTEKTVQMLNQ